MSGKSLMDRISSQREDNKNSATCADIVFCEKILSNSPKGIFPGIW